MKHIAFISIILAILIYSIYEKNNYAQKENLEAIIQHTFMNNPKIKELIYMIAAKDLAESEKKIEIDPFVKQILKKLNSSESIKKLGGSYTKRYKTEELAKIRALIENPIYDRYMEETVEITKESLREVDSVIKEILETQETKKTTTFSSTIMEITSQNFEEKIQNSTVPLVLEFYAEWCAPCKGMEIILSELKTDFEEKIQFTRLNIENEKEIAEKFKRKDLPVVLFIKEGKILGIHSGFGDKETLQSKMQHFFAL